MGAGVLAATSLFGLMLARPLFAALGGKNAELRAANRNARSATARADQAKRDAAKLKKKNAGLAKALEIARKQDSRDDAPPAPPAPPEPPLYDVEVGPAVIKPKEDKPKADVLKELGDEQPTKRDWAERLYTYALREIREGRSANLGSKGNPNQHVLAAQKGMGKLNADGIYGDKTRSRGKELLGKPFPARESAKQAQKKKPAPAPVQSRPAASPPAPAPAPVQAARPTSVPSGPRPGTPVQRTPVQAANEMLKHARELIGAGQASKLGTKAAPSAFVAAAQRDMGELDVDGIYGPAVRKRGKQLTGETFPARV